MARAISSALTSASGQPPRGLREIAPLRRARTPALVAVPADLPLEPIIPIVKWAGGKSRLLVELTQRMPSPRQWTGRYFEPFAGGLALYFHMRPASAVLADMNPELINLYKVVRDQPDALVEDLQRHTA